MTLLQRRQSHRHASVLKCHLDDCRWLDTWKSEPVYRHSLPTFTCRWSKADDARKEVKTSQTDLFNKLCVIKWFFFFFSPPEVSFSSLDLCIVSWPALCLYHPDERRIFLYIFYESEIRSKCVWGLHSCWETDSVITHRFRKQHVAVCCVRAKALKVHAANLARIWRCLYFISCYSLFLVV